MLIRKLEDRERYWKLFTPAGLLSICLSIIMGRYGEAFRAAYFMEGFFMGLAIAASVVGVITAVARLSEDRGD